MFCRFNNVAIGRYSAQGTPSKLSAVHSQPESPSRSVSIHSNNNTPKKQPCSKPPLTPVSSHRRMPSDSSSIPDANANARGEGPKAQRQASNENPTLLKTESHNSVGEIGPSTIDSNVSSCTPSQKSKKLYINREKTCKLNQISYPS